MNAQIVEWRQTLSPAKEIVWVSAIDRSLVLLQRDNERFVTLMAGFLTPCPRLIGGWQDPWAASAEIIVRVAGVIDVVAQPTVNIPIIMAATLPVYVRTGKPLPMRLFGVFGAPLDELRCFHEVALNIADALTLNPFDFKDKGFSL